MFFIKLGTWILRLVFFCIMLLSVVAMFVLNMQLALSLLAGFIVLQLILSFFGTKIDPVQNIIDLVSRIGFGLFQMFSQISHLLARQIASIFPPKWGFLFFMIAWVVAMALIPVVLLLLQELQIISKGIF